MSSTADLAPHMTEIKASVEVATWSPYTWVRREEVESAVASVDRQVALDTEGNY